MHYQLARPMRGFPSYCNVTWTFLKMSLSHRLSVRTTPFLMSASFLRVAKSKSHLLSDVLACPKTCGACRRESSPQYTTKCHLFQTLGHSFTNTFYRFNAKQNKSKNVSVTLSNMRFSRRGTTGKTVGCSVFRSSIKRRISP